MTEKTQVDKNRWGRIIQLTQSHSEGMTNEYKASCILKCLLGKVIPSIASQPIIDLVTNSIVGSVTCCETCDYFPSYRASPSFDQYQIILPSYRGTCVWTMWPELLHDSCGTWRQTSDPSGKMQPLYH